jgi:hypothetical protein
MFRPGVMSCHVMWGDPDAVTWGRECMTTECASAISHHAALLAFLPAIAAAASRLPQPAFDSARRELARSFACSSSNHHQALVPRPPASQVFSRRHVPMERAAGPSCRDAFSIGNSEAWSRVVPQRHLRHEHLAFRAPTRRSTASHPPADQPTRPRGPRPPSLRLRGPPERRPLDGVYMLDLTRRLPRISKRSSLPSPRTCSGTRRPTRPVSAFLAPSCPTSSRPCSHGRQQVSSEIRNAGASDDAGVMELRN